MKLRILPLGLLAAVAVVAAGCGSSDNSSTNSSTTSSGGSGKTITTDLPPRTSKANIVGGNAPIDEFAQKAANDAINFWTQIFQKNNIDYVAPTATVAMSATDNGCGAQFDPTTKAFYLCASQDGSKITLGGPFLDTLRTSNGDGAVAFLAGLTAAADANNQLSGNPLSKGAPDDAFLTTSLCFTGAWIKNLSDRQLLEQGDDAEILDAAGKAFGGGNPQASADAVKQGFNQGTGSCQKGGASPGG